ncbi:hypothetical protein [Photobacterium sp. R1]
MYDNIEIVLGYIKLHFELLFKEKFNVRPDFRFAEYTSENYRFIVHADFIQARVDSDKETPIEKRIDDCLDGFEINKSKTYEFIKVDVNKPMPQEYAVKVSS